MNTYVKGQAVKFALEQATKAQRGSEGIAVLGTHFIGGWVGPRAGLDGCGRYSPQRDWIEDVCTFMLTF